MREVEIFVKVLDSKEKAMGVLKKFTFLGSKKVFDTYYYDSSRDNLQAKDGCYPKEWFRLRKRDDKCFLTYKKDIFDKDRWVYSEEDEVEVSGFEVSKNIIKNLGFEELITINNMRHTFETELYEIVLEEVEGLGLYMEVERLKVGEDEDVFEVKKEIQNFLDSLEIDLSEEMTAGKPEMMLKKMGKC
jgi:adenylate cyclase class 2